MKDTYTLKEVLDAIDAAELARRKAESDYLTQFVYGFVLLSVYLAVALLPQVLL
jgi:hypothetical protein